MRRPGIFCLQKRLQTRVKVQIQSDFRAFCRHGELIQIKIYLFINANNT